jgi:hypothetical protein
MPTTPYSPPFSVKLLPLLTFSRCITVQKLASCGLVDSFGKYDSMELSNRYFTAKKEVTAEQVVPLSPAIDPNGFLAEAAGKMYAHCTQNVVQYFVLNATPGGTDRLVSKMDTSSTNNV